MEAATADGPDLVANGHMPASLTRSHEAQLQRLAEGRDLDPSLWRSIGPPFFMAGFAVLLASSRGFNRPRLLDLAEILHPGMSEPEVFRLWVQHSPLEPSRFFAQLDHGEALASPQPDFEHISQNPAARIA